MVNTNAIVKQWEMTMGLCDNFWCSRIGLLETIYHEGHPAANICVGECDDWDTPEDEDGEV